MNRAPRTCAMCKKTPFARCIPTKIYLCRSCLREHAQTCACCAQQISTPGRRATLETNVTPEAVGATPAASTPTGELHDRHSFAKGKSANDLGTPKSGYVQEGVLKLDCVGLGKKNAKLKLLKFNLQAELEDAEVANASAARRLKIHVALCAHLALHD